MSDVLKNNIDSIKELLASQDGIPTSEENLEIYHMLQPFAKFMAEWEMNTRKSICSKVFEENDVKRGSSKTINNLNGFKLKVKNNGTPKIDLELADAEDLDDLCFILEDELTVPEKECFYEETKFDFTKFKNLQKENPQEKYKLSEYVFVVDAAPNITIEKL